MQMLRAGQMQAQMNITPFIDVLLVLLVIFMLSIKVRHVMSAQVAQEDQGSGKSRVIVLELANDGGYRLNTVPVLRAALDSTLRAAFAVRPDKILFVKAGGRRTYGETIEAMDVARGAGVQVIGLAP